MRSNKDAVRIIVLDVRGGFHGSRVLVGGRLSLQVGHAQKTPVGSDGGFTHHGEGAEKMSDELLLRGHLGPHGWVLVGPRCYLQVEMRGGVWAWGVATTSGSAVTGCWTVVAAPELRNLYPRHFLCEGADEMGVSGAFQSPVSWCFVLPVSMPRRSVCDSPSFPPQQLPGRGSASCR